MTLEKPQVTQKNCTNPNGPAPASVESPFRWPPTAAGPSPGSPAPAPRRPAWPWGHRSRRSRRSPWRSLWRRSPWPGQMAKMNPISERGKKTLLFDCCLSLVLSFLSKTWYFGVLLNELFDSKMEAKKTTKNVPVPVVWAATQGRELHLGMPGSSDCLACPGSLRPYVALRPKAVWTEDVSTWMLSLHFHLTGTIFKFDLSRLSRDLSQKLSWPTS